MLCSFGSCGEDEETEIAGIRRQQGESGLARHSAGCGEEKDDHRAGYDKADIERYPFRPKEILSSVAELVDK